MWVVPEVLVAVPSKSPLAYTLTVEPASAVTVIVGVLSLSGVVIAAIVGVVGAAVSTACVACVAAVLLLPAASVALS